MAQYWLFFGVKKGLDPLALCATAGVLPSDIADRDRQIPYAWLAAIRAGILAALPNVAVGVELGTFASPDQFGYAGQALRYCETPRDILSLLVRFCALSDSAFRESPMSLVEAAETVDLCVPTQSMAMSDPPECIEAIFVSHVSMMRASLGEPISPREVRFAHRRKDAARRALEEFFTGNVRFGAPDNALQFDRCVLDRAFPGADVSARGHFEAQARKLLDHPQPLAAIVTREVELRLSRGDLSQERIAKSLAVSTRGLQRRLKDEGTSYTRIVAAARQSIAVRLLRDPALATYEVALAVGYDDVRCFDRFFRRSMGVTPRAYRDRPTD